MGRKDELVDGAVDDSERISYVEDHLRWILKAVECGVNVTGYFMWSLQDQFSWTNGYNKRYGFFYVDFETQKRTPKASAYWFTAHSPARDDWHKKTRRRESPSRRRTPLESAVSSARSPT